MHGLNTIIKINKEQQEFIDRILARPSPEVNLLEVWRQFKKEKNEQLQVRTD